MNRLELLLAAFISAVSEPWPATLSLAERIWFLVYEPEDHRKLALRLPEFELATRQTGKHWKEVSLATAFPQWMANHDYREAYFDDPEAISDELEGSFKDDTIAELNNQISALNPDGQTITVIKDVHALFGLVRLSDVLDGLNKKIPGRILILFPGSFEQNHYRLLNARDGWSYLARPITAIT